MSPIVDMVEVHKSYGRVEVLKGVTFSVDKGEVAAIIGQSGSGKSTALRCMDRLETIQAGTLEVCGHRLDTPNLDLRALRRDVGIVFQSYNLYPHLTVEQNVTLALRLVRRIGRAEARERAANVLRKVGMLDKLAAYPEQLSGGQQQRVAIARGLAMEPKLMLFDEVTSALDPQLTGEVLRVMEELAAEGMTMVLVTHEMSFARRVADKVIYMRDGRVHEMGTSDILRTPQTKELGEFISEATDA
ncbi:amino acid ABC transporter ATP-binding protein [Devosia sp. YIM 151766]|uniref:amino acid ABC transporter ATP-binding protein n=1 Tax=Devosia sp. YIM 151766 TaxID=3017325 RepID=UPI00255C28B3|nr:amino acid ABC transporter ATP-binding protein [Devosia sp. YIM 151766]WIY52580.1 amino acid ABC transporter ATP-binding protein [Devosia sp. YIM 151766]